MVGGTIRRKLIHRESFRASVLRLTLETMRCKNHRTGLLRLDIAFVLIDGTRKAKSMRRLRGYLGEESFSAFPARSGRPFRRGGGLLQGAFRNCNAGCRA